MKTWQQVLYYALWFFMTVGCLFLYGLLFLFDQVKWVLPLISCQFAVIVCLSIVWNRKIDAGKLLSKIVKPVIMGIGSVVFSLLLCMAVNNLSLNQVDEYDAIVTRTTWNACFYNVYFETPDGDEQSAKVLDFRIIVADDSMIKPQEYVHVREYVGLFGLEHYEIIQEFDEP
ncbi:MAG: hypothetical protein E7645_08990 [Ruminococcaceae bacterium]|nr:hypothetical protein [Oscillospiraceae bacterium]